MELTKAGSRTASTCAGSFDHLVGTGNQRGRDRAHSDQHNELLAPHSTASSTLTTSVRYQIRHSSRGQLLHRDREFRVGFMKSHACSLAGTAENPYTRRKSLQRQRLLLRANNG